MTPTERLAEAFVAHLRANLSDDELYLADKGYPVTAPLLFAAFTDTFNRLPDGSEEDLLLMQQAWDLARARGFARMQ